MAGEKLQTLHQPSEISHNWLIPTTSPTYSSGSVEDSTQDDPVLITSTDHDLSTGDFVYIVGVVGMTEINDRTFTITVEDADTFSLDNEDGTGHTAYISGGYWIKGRLSAVPISLILNPIEGYTLLHNALGSGSGSRTIDLSLGNYVSATSTGSTAWTFSNPPSSNAGGFVLKLTDGGAAAQTWPASVKWPEGEAPELTADGVDVLAFITDDGGTTWRGTLSMLDSR